MEEHLLIMERKITRKNLILKMMLLMSTGVVNGGCLLQNNLVNCLVNVKDILGQNIKLLKDIL